MLVLNINPSIFSQKSYIYLVSTMGPAMNDNWFYHRIGFLFLFVLCALPRAWAQDCDWAQLNINASRNVATDAAGNSILLGEGSGTFDLNPGPGVQMVTAPWQNTFIQKFDSNGQFLWGGILASPKSNYPNGLVVDQHTGKIYLVGHLLGTADFDIGPGIDSVGVNDYFGTYLICLDPSGNYQWGHVIDNIAIPSDCGPVMSLDEVGNLYFAGTVFDSADFDLGPGSAMIHDQGYGDCFFVKYDTLGDLAWLRHLGSPYYEYMWAIAVSDSGVYITGVFNDTLDLDAGVDSFIVYNSNFADMFVARYDLNGDFRWADVVGNLNGIEAYGIGVTQDGRVLLAGDFGGATDFDPGPGLAVVTPTATANSFVLQLDADGNYGWVKIIESTWTLTTRQMRLDSTGAVYLATMFAGTADFDPGLGVLAYTTTALNVSNLVILKLNALGESVWAGHLAGPSSCRSLALDRFDNVYAVGEFSGIVDFAPTVTQTFPLGGLGQVNNFLLKWDQGGCDNFVLVIDSASPANCAGQPGYMSGRATDGLLPYSYVWNTTPASLDSFATTALGGIFTLVIHDAYGCQLQRGVLIDGPSTIIGHDLIAHLISPPFRPGIPASITLDAYNQGCTGISGQAKMVLDTLLLFQSALPAPSSIVGDTLFWNYATMNADSGHFSAQVQVITDLSAQIGDTIHLGAIVTPIAGDQQPLDNVRTDYEFPVVNSADPNLKSAYPPGACAEHYVLRNTPLTYTIQFQNTGTAEALEVYVLDTLDANLDPATLHVHASSHNLITEVMPPGNILRFAFHNIHLPDSGTNEPASHGYVVYEIMPTSNTVSGTVIENDCAIYFDFNAPVITNAVMHTVVDIVPACPVGVMHGIGLGGIEVFPNPASTQVYIRADIALGDVRIVNMLGQVMWARTDVQENAVVLDVHGWVRGMYVVYASGKSQRVVVW
jgi:hypothetical protein